MQDQFWLRFAMGVVIYPATAVLFYGFARLVALAVRQWMPESRLKDRLLTDTATGRVARRADKRRNQGVERLPLR
jgi:hypothetical protein